MKSDNTIRNGTSIFVGIIVAIAAFVHGALLLPLLLVACPTRASGMKPRAAQRLRASWLISVPAGITR